jgi:hypothetical protein
MSEPAFKCEKCKFSTNTPIKWQAHIELASHIKKTGGTPRDKSVKYKCPYCKREYAFMSKLCIHMNSKCSKRPITASPQSEEEEEEEIAAPPNIVAQESKVIKNANGDTVNVNLNIINEKEPDASKPACNCQRCQSGDTSDDLEEMVNRFIDRKRMIYCDDDLFHSQVYVMEMYSPTNPPVPDTNKVNYNEPMPDIEPIMRLIRHSRKMRKYMFSVLYELLEEDFRQSKVVEEVKQYAEKRGFDVFTKDDFNLHVEGRNNIYIRSMHAREKEDGNDIPGFSSVMEKPV